MIAVATWPREESERVDARWRLVVASRETGELLFDKRVGDMNVLGMFPATTGELMIVEPIRSADGNSADGFVVHAYDPGANEVREAARFVDGDLYPSSLTLLSNGHLGVVGTESARRLRIVVFDWQSNQTLTDVTLDDVPLEADAPDGVFVDNMGHPVIWDQPRGRVLVVHAHEDVITTVGVPDGEIERVPLLEGRSLLGALLAWAVPAADAKGLPSVQRHAVVSGDHLYVAGRAITFESETENSYTYTVTATELLKVNLNTLRIERRRQLEADVIAGSPHGGYLIGGGRTTTGQVGFQRTTTENDVYTPLLIIDPETLEVVDRYEQAHLDSEFQVLASPREDIIYLQDPAGGILTFDPTTGHIVATERGYEPALLKNSLRYASHLP